MKNKITTVDQDKICDKVNEQELVNEITKVELFNWLEENGYTYSTLESLLEDKKANSHEQNNFNIIMRKAKKETNISITEMIIYFEETFTKFKKILSLFDNETKYELKKELSVKYKIKIEESNLKQILL